VHTDEPHGTASPEADMEESRKATQAHQWPATTSASGWRDSLALALGTTDMQVLWLATLTYHLGLGMQQVLLGWVVLALTNSEGMVGVVFAVRSAPNLVVGFVAGALTDRYDRRHLMRLAAFGMTGVVLALAWLAYTEQLTIRLFLLCTAVLGVGQAFEMTARQAYIVDTLGAHHAAQGIALISLAQRSGGVLGSLLAGAIITWWGVAVTFLVMGTGYSIGACVLYALRQQGMAAPTRRESMRQNLLTYLRALRSNRDVRSLMLSTAAAELFGFSHQVMLPILAKEVFQVGAGGLGVLTALRFLGGVLGVSGLTLLGGVRRHGRMLLVVLILFGAGQILLAYAPAFWVAAIGVVLINIMAAATDVLHQTLLQVSVANEQRGRAMGSWIIGTGIAPVGHLEVGYLAGLTSAHLALLMNGLALIILTCSLAIGLPRLRRL